MIYATKKEIALRLHECDNPTFSPSIARTALKAADLVERLIESKEPRKELASWLKEQNSL